MRLNLETKSKEQELVKAYLEENASETLAEKINIGTPFEKDGKTFINKKTLDGFMKYASDEARKLASKGANSACVEDKVVYGWSKTTSCSAGLSTISKKTVSKAHS